MLFLPFVDEVTCQVGCSQLIPTTLSTLALYILILCNIYSFLFPYLFLINSFCRVTFLLRTIVTAGENDGVFVTRVSAFYRE